jgi:hypothetical protein
MASSISLPSSLLLLVLASSLQAISAEAQSPNKPDVGENYWPDHEALVKRGLESMKRIQYQTPIGVRKMSTDPDEMFFLDYWEFEDTDTNSEPDICPTNRTDYTPGANESYSDIQPPVLLHSVPDPQRQHGLFARYIPLVKRDFQCPSGYNGCGSISASSLCCQTGQTCISIQNGGSGNVGCCPTNSNCGSGSQIGSCDTGLGYTGCPGGSGCCIPNFTCFSSGCKSHSKASCSYIC